MKNKAKNKAYEELGVYYYSDFCYLSNIAIYSASNVIHTELDRSSLMLCA